MARARKGTEGSERKAEVTEASVAREPLAAYGPIARITRQDRLEIRIDADSKRLIEEASALEGQTMSAFMLSVSLTHARQVVEASRITALSVQDWSVVQNMLVNPPPPTTELKKAARAYKKRIVRSDGF